MDLAAMDLAGGRWLNPPPDWRLEAGELKLVTGPHTDFWRETFYGFTRDSGHFLGLAAGPGFTAEVRVRAEFESLYDQAGLMIRVDAARWVKAGVERSDGENQLSVVVTDGRSDWSVARPFPVTGDFRIRATLSGGALRVQASPDGRVWPLLRLAPFAVEGACEVGPMACTPERGGLAVRFSDFALTEAQAKDLHDLS